MEQALAMLVHGAAGTGGPTNPNSRYYGSPVETLIRAGGPPVAYLRRRIIPPPQIYAALQDYAVVDGDRLDNLAAKFLGDPGLFWMICDANAAPDPDALTAETGRTIKIPVAAGVPANARHG